MAKGLKTFLGAKSYVCRSYSGKTGREAFLVPPSSIGLIKITKSIRKNLHEGSFGCGIFVYLQKVFDTVDHKIQLHKLEFGGTRGVSNDWFKLLPS